jgi:phage shock protein C
METIKKLYLVKEGKKVCGLCNGIGEYFEIDPTIIRLAWLVFVFIGGTGLLAYFIGALVVPTKPKDL